MPRPTTFHPIKHRRASSPGVDAADVKTIKLTPGTSAIEVTVETTSARVTFDGTDPSAASAPSIVIPKDLAPKRFDIGQPAVVKFCSTTALNASVLQVLELE